jgi:hypothetical protein
MVKKALRKVTVCNGKSVNKLKKSFSKKKAVVVESKPSAAAKESSPPQVVVEKKPPVILTVGNMTDSTNRTPGKSGVYRLVKPAKTSSLNGQMTPVDLPEVIFIQSVHNYSGAVKQVTGLDIKPEVGKALKYYYVEDNVEFERLSDIPKEVIPVVLKNLRACIGSNWYNSGCDPEIFVVDKANQLIPAFQFLGPKPEANDPVRKNGSLKPAYWDGFQAEFETNPTGCMQRQGEQIGYGLEKVWSEARKKFPDAKLSLKTVMDIDPNLLKETKPEHAQFGCRESLNVYGMRGERRDGYDVLFRPTGGHLHFGIGQQPQEVIDHIVKAMDAIVGIACVSMFDKFDDPRRRTMYGLAGEYRLPPHGIEYRTLSNAWLSSPVVAHLVFDLARKALNIGFVGMLDQIGFKYDEKEVIRIINTCDVKAAREMMKANEQVYLLIFHTIYWYYEKNNIPEDYSRAAFKAFYEGLENLLANPEDITGNWGLTRARQYAQFSQVVPLVLANKKVA